VRLIVTQLIADGRATELEERSRIALTEAVDGSGDELLAGATRTSDQHRCIGTGHRGQDAQNASHRLAARNHARDLDTFLRGIPGGPSRPDIAERFHPTQEGAIAVPECSGADADRELRPLAGQDLDVLGSRGFAGSDGLPHRALSAAQASPEDLVAGAADRLPGGVAGDLFGSAVPVGDLEVRVDGEDTVGHAVEDDIHQIAGSHGPENPHTSLRRCTLAQICCNATQRVLRSVGIRAFMW
jgi:hypothetical protein